MPCRVPFFALVLSLAVLLAPHPVRAITFDQAMAGVDPQARYLFYLHGQPAHKAGEPPAVSPRYGAYQTSDIVAHFEDRGLTVIDDIPMQDNANRSAAEVIRRMRVLMAAGVAPGNITVAGYSKGGFVALLVSSGLGDPRVGYVIMAGCGTGRNGFAFEQFLAKKRGARLKGRMLSVFAANDMEAGSCQGAVEQATGGGLVFQETRIRSSKGHGLFYQPLPEWIIPVARWARDEQ
ncbi:MAG: hypothetical protein KUA35_01235 [Pseudodesulfovibrio sp.]|uniref:Phospholipase/Carboxylesterase n=1 Tax=Pseudodesulfovibrio aespoeensis (strain ATCC 700646 / DSM 10631 / Aspo-2) TaxID=643562 RepID=E6VVP2_PSEA9|nr:MULTISPECIES: hypothetical protein [Pseudodesulfovibrio]MBU4192277.1 hypothetical protein [Pseudomonadota bacterium]ADU61244.1 hypothetical protein Daes_0217 [Pseudodesulfovibrio aespoeensis Aspo-2]MBU4245102.1 hypothetical protein [Pseudomonadota bacterium]MBU4379576.1 hypothetical protein [Pseudomonadota bacterium]MBU4474300.1 hypothetical protein [Pseudomonadota bacterium]